MSHSTSHFALTCIAVLLLFGIAGHVAGPDEFDVGEPLARPAPLVRTSQAATPAGEVVLVCRPNGSPTAKHPRAVQRPGPFYIHYLVDGQESETDGSNETSLTCRLKNSQGE